MDFVSDQLSDGRKIRSLTIVDIFTRESLATGIQCESSSQGSRLQNPRGIRQSYRGEPRYDYNSNQLKTNPQNGTDFSGPSTLN